ncbi:class F sortase [Microbacterium terricola]|uniref:class F sortase n=1 Tax=Microbacterium terricola TaxID=344163 RepID=UPI0021E719FC|nr:class F sortase [Microbacterium terricola]UYK40370.1 class F sortase [Microbacterium terricola]
MPIAAATAAPVRKRVAPERVVIDALGIDVPVVPVGVEKGGFMELPDDPAVAGWYRFGSDPDSAEGSTVISAHIDAPQYPIGPFSRLRDLATGQAVEVIDAAGDAHRYRVDSVTYYPKAELPAGDLFERDGAPALVLITCGGAFDARTGHYDDNVVVIATPTS